jgi:hypothetical protein
MGADGLRTARGGLFQSCDGKGSPAARGNADHHVVRSDVVAADSGRAFLDRVFRILYGFHDGALATGDQVNQLVVGPVEGGRQFGAVLNADAAGGARTHIDEASTSAQARDRLFRRSRDGGKRRPDGGYGRELPFVESCQHLKAWPRIDILKTGAEMFCRHGLPF